MRSVCLLVAALLLGVPMMMLAASSSPLLATLVLGPMWYVIEAFVISMQDRP